MSVAYHAYIHFWGHRRLFSATFLCHDVHPAMREERSGNQGGSKIRGDRFCQATYPSKSLTSVADQGKILFWGHRRLFSTSFSCNDVHPAMREERSGNQAGSKNRGDRFCQATYPSKSLTSVADQGKIYFWGHRRLFSASF
jgi:hypothetical protein